MLQHNMQGARDACAGGLAQARARASIGPAVATATVFIQAGGAGQPAVPVAIGAAPTTILTATVSTALGRRFRVTATWRVTSDGTAGLTVFNPNSLAAPQNVPAVADTEVTRTEVFIVQFLGALPATETINLQLQASVAGHLTVAALGASMIIEPIPGF
jgi:hypothetical protein